MQQKLIAFIGGGNMAQAIVLGLLKQGYPADKIIVNDPNEEKRAFFAQYGIAVSTDNDQSITQSQVVLFAVKPQVFADVCKPLSAVDFSDKLIISIAAGYFDCSISRTHSNSKIHCSRDAKHACISG